MLLSAVSVLVVAQSSSEIPEGLMNNPVHRLITVLLAHQSFALQQYYKERESEYSLDRLVCWQNMCLGK